VELVAGLRDRIVGFMKPKAPLFSAPRIQAMVRAWRADAQTSDWTYYGLLYAGIFGAFTTVGIAAAWTIGPSELAEERRKKTRPMRRIDLSEGWSR